MPNASAGFICDHPCRQTYTQAADEGQLETDYSKLYTTVQRHAHTSYCTRKLLCHFMFPFSYSDSTSVEWVPDEKEKDVWILKLPPNAMIAGQ